MKFIREHIRNNKKNLKGFTLIEVLLVATLIGIATSTYMTMAFKYSKVFRNEMNISKEKFNVNQAFIIIEKEIDDAKEISIDKNQIVLKNCTTNCWDYIKKDKKSNIVIAYDNGALATNNILKSANEFNVYEKQGVLYICIQMNSERRYERCLNIQWKKSLKDLY